MSHLKNEKEGDILEKEDEKKPRNKSKKKKVKAWCGECYQFFENGPFTKVCKEHLNKGKCSLIECKKQLLSKKDLSQCIRRFPNTNSENRHTYCITEEEVKNWEEECKLQNCLGVKRGSDINYAISKTLNLNNASVECKLPVSEISPSNNNICSDANNVNESKEITLNLNFDNLIPNSNYKNYTEYNLIDEINNLNLWNEKYFLDDNLINSFNNIYFNTPDKNKKESKSIQTDEEKSDHQEGLKNSLCVEIKENKITEDEIKIEEINKVNNINIIPAKMTIKIQDNENIDEIFEKVYTDTKIPKSHLNKLKSAFKKKGIFTAKILRLFKAKNKNLNFLIDEFKNICSQIEGVALFLETIL